MWAIPTGTVRLKKKNQVKESQSRVSHPKLDSDPPIGSGRDSGRDIYSCPCGVHSPYGTRNTCCCPLWRDPILFELAISGTARFVLHAGPATLRLLGE